MKLEGITGTLKTAMRAKRIRQTDLAEATNTTLSTVRKAMAKTNINTDTLIAYAEVLGCRVVLEDIETGEIYR